MSIPSVDLAHFTQGQPEDRRAFVQALGQAYETVGFVAVKNHGIPDALIADLYRHVQAFFALPEAVKRSYEIAGLAGQRGYTSFGKEHAKGSHAPDLKEFFQFGQVNNAGLSASEQYPDHVVVTHIDAFSPTLTAAYQHFEASGAALLQAIALFLGLEEGVNQTLGLPFVRTSPDHGTAFDIAGKGIADPRSLLAALAAAKTQL